MRASAACRSGAAGCAPAAGDDCAAGRATVETSRSRAGGLPPKCETKRGHSTDGRAMSCGRGSESARPNSAVPCAGAMLPRPSCSAFWSKPSAAAEPVPLHTPQSMLSAGRPSAWRRWAMPSRKAAQKVWFTWRAEPTTPATDEHSTKCFTGCARVARSSASAPPSLPRATARIVSSVCSAIAASASRPAAWTTPCTWCWRRSPAMKSASAASPAWQWTGTVTPAGGCGCWRLTSTSALAPRFASHAAIAWATPPRAPVISQVPSDLVRGGADAGLRQPRHLAPALGIPAHFGFGLAGHDFVDGRDVARRRLQEARLQRRHLELQRAHETGQAVMARAAVADQHEAFRGGCRLLRDRDELAEQRHLCIFRRCRRRHDMDARGQARGRRCSVVAARDDHLAHRVGSVEALLLQQAAPGLARQQRMIGPQVLGRQSATSPRSGRRRCRPSDAPPCSRPAAARRRAPAPRAHGPASGAGRAWHAGRWPPARRRSLARRCPARRARARCRGSAS